MKTVRVLLIESARKNSASFAPSLKRKYQVRIAHTGKQGLAFALEHSPNIIVLDAVSMRTSGNRICARLRANLEQTPIIHIRAKEASSGESAADVLLSPPFTARKLINRIDRFTVPTKGKIVEVGPFSLNADNQTLVTPWTEKKLTPKLVELMKLFMSNLNQTLERKEIMQHVWKTDYMGDTRTLDVHIRWLRKAVEPNPRQPKFITTVRGVGYRLVVPDDTDQSQEPPP